MVVETHDDFTCAENGSMYAMLRLPKNSSCMPCAFQYGLFVAGYAPTV